MYKKYPIQAILPLLLILHLPLDAKKLKTSEDYIEQAKKDLPQQCIFFFKMYLNAKSPKAFTYAIDDNSKYTCRFSSKSDSYEKAKEVALKSCQKSRIKRGIKSECKVYDLNLEGFRSKREEAFRNRYKESIKKITDELKRIKKIKKSDLNSTKLTKKSITKEKHIKKIQYSTPKTKSSLETNLQKLPKPCHMFYKLYEQSPGFKAFAIAIDNDKKYVCKFSAKSISLDKAKSVALKSCQKSKKIRDVKSSCEIFAFKSAKLGTVFKTKFKAKKIKKVEPRKRVRDSALEQAILDTNLNKIKELIKKGANIDTEADDHSRALFVATAKGDVKFVKELVNKGAYPFFTKGDGNNLLVAAIMSGKIELLKLFLELGVDPNQQCSEGNTPLHFAFMMFYDDMMKELYKAGARDDIPNDKGESVQDMAKAYHVNLRKMKQSYGSN